MNQKIKVKQIRKRDGRVVKFEKGKVVKAIHKALTATGEGNKRNAQELAKKVDCEINKRFTVRNGGGKMKVEIPTVEEVQDIVENFLIRENYIDTAKSYIIYREQHRLLRESQDVLKKSVDLVDDYLKEIDWQVKENSNMSYSLQGLNNYIANVITSKYWVEKIYPPEIREAYNKGDFHIHDLGLLAVYCCGWDLKDLITHGFGGVSGKSESKAPKHFRSALGQIVNFFYTLQGEAAGAQAFSNFDTLLAPFIKYDVVIGGVPQKEQYKDFTNEVSLLNKAFAEIMLEGDASGRVFTFPIPTYNITKDFNWDDPNLEPIWEMTAKYGIPYFANYVNSDMKPEDARSMCCRLRLDNRELYKRGGGLFGAYPLTGSIGVVTINLPRIGYLAKNKKNFYDKLGKAMDLAKESLEIKRKTLENFTEKGLYPYSKHFLANMKLQRGEYWGNHFSTIGIIGMNEALLNFLGGKTDITTKKGNSFAQEILEFMRNKIVKYQEETGGLYNLEATPGEGTSYRLAKKDVAKYPDIITAAV